MSLLHHQSYIKLNSDDVDHNLTMNEQRPLRRTHRFLESLATQTSISKSQARVKLARKLAERTRAINQRKKLREKMRKLAKDLETKEAEIELIQEDVIKLEAAVEEGTDGEND